MKKYRRWWSWNRFHLSAGVFPFVPRIVFKLLYVRYFILYSPSIIIIRRIRIIDVLCYTVIILTHHSC